MQAINGFPIQLNENLMHNMFKELTKKNLSQGLSSDYVSLLNKLGYSIVN